MARSKKVPLHPWETANSEEKPRYIRTSYSLLTHPAYQKLTLLEKHVYNCMRMACAGKQEFTFPQACYENEYGLHKTSVIKAVQKLQGAGFIEVVESNRFLRKPNVYRFSYDWKTRRKPP